MGPIPNPQCLIIKSYYIYKNVKIYFIISYLINIYKCDKKEEIETFLINPNLVKEKEINIQTGKIFCIKIFTSSYVLLNKKENSDTIPFQKTDSYTEHYEQENIGGRRGYLYYFKANSITKEPRVLKFTDTYSYLKQKEPIPKLIIKVNVVN